MKPLGDTGTSAKKVFRTLKKLTPSEHCLGSIADGCQLGE
jgi:hypothetical protein